MIFVVFASGITFSIIVVNNKNISQSDLVAINDVVKTVEKNWGHISEDTFRNSDMNQPFTIIDKQINKGIGDTLEVEYGTRTSSFLVTGLSQSIGNLGQIASLTMEGIKQLQPDYTGTTLHVYLDGIINKDFINNVQQQHGNSIEDTLDIDENIESQTSIYTTAIFAVMVIVLTINIVVVAVILYLVGTTMITKRKRELGVMKAIGFSTIQLMHQLSIGFLPVIFAGVVIGGILGMFFTNPMLSLLLSSVGVKRLDFIIHLPIIFMLCIGILILAYVVSMLVALKIKKITAYSLITE